MDTKHPTPSKPARTNDQRGTSLIEAVVVIAVMAIAATGAAPSLAAFIDGRRLDAAANQLAADIQLVRSEAVARNRTLRLSFHATADASCWIVHTGEAAQCRCGPIGPAICSGDAMEIKTVVLGAADRVSVQSNVASIVFDPLHGTSTPTGTLRLVGADGRAVHHVVNVMGRVRSCSPDATVPGWRAC